MAEGVAPLLDEVRFSPPTGDMLADVVQKKKKKPSAGRLADWVWRELKALPIAWLDKLAKIPEGCLQCYDPLRLMEMPHLWDMPLSAQSIVHRLWASVRCNSFRAYLLLGYLSGSSVLAVVAAAALDMEESLSGALDSDVHIFVAKVVKSFDTVDHGLLDYVLSRLGLPGWSRNAYILKTMPKVRLGSKLASGLGQSLTRDRYLAGVPAEYCFHRCFFSHPGTGICGPLGGRRRERRLIRSLMRATFYASLVMRTTCWRLPGSLTGFSGWLDKIPALRTCVLLSTWEADERLGSSLTLETGGSWWMLASAGWTLCP